MIISDLHLLNAHIMAEVLIAEHMLAWFLPHREHYALRLLLSCLAALALAWAFPIQTGNYVGWGTLMYASLFVISGLTIACSYDEAPMAVLCCAITGYTVHQMSSTLQDALTGIMSLCGISVSHIACWTGVTVLVYLSCFLIFSRNMRAQKHIRVDSRTLPLLSIGVLLVDIVSGLELLDLQRTYTAPEYEIMLQLFDGLACIFILSLQFGLISNRELKTELGIVSRMLQEEKRQYENSRQNIEVINQKCHDLKHQLRTLRHQDGDVDRSVLEEIEQAVDVYDTSVQTGNAALDVILTEKKLLCESDHINLTCLADGSGLNAMTPPDIYALFGNALDNAIEAVRALSEAEKRTISLTVRGQSGMTVIHVENRFEGAFSMKDGLPETTKGDNDYHGYGMKSIRAIAEKYGGYLTVSAEQHIFRLTVMIPAA